MFNKISVFITDTLIDGNVITKEQRSVYIYCFQTLIELFSNLMLTLILGVIFGKIIETIIFLLVFIPLRSTAGGYHCKTATRCLYLSILVYLFVIFTCELIIFLPKFVCIIVCIVNFMVIYLYSPITSSNKPITIDEKNINRKISILIILIDIFTVIIMMMFNFGVYFIILETTTVAVISLVVEVVKLKIYTKRYHSATNIDHSA